jgi:hypothetical protein
MPSCSGQLCEECGDWLIHQGARKLHESASPLGQWIHNDLPKRFTSGDVDQYIRRWYRHQQGESVLLRWIEHKAPGQKYAGPQKAALQDFDSVIRHAVDCSTAPIRLRPSSGVYVVHSTFTDGQPSDIRVERLCDGRSVPMHTHDFGMWIWEGTAA